MTDQSEATPDCKKCMSHLLSSLKSVKSSKPLQLFQAMGADVSSYELNSTGVTVHIPQSTLLNSVVTTISSKEGNLEKNSTATIHSEIGFGGGNTNEMSGNTGDKGKDTMMGNLKNRLTKRFQQSAQAVTAPQQATVATSALTKPAIELQITCQKCGNDGPEGGARAFVKGPNPLSIVLCSNRLSTKEEITEVLVHELMHVYDVHYRNWDLTNCYTLAKSEVRAAREAECADATMSFTKRYCAKEKARVATKNMFPDVGLQCVAAVFEEAMKDKEPFFEKKESRMRSNYKMSGRSFQSTYPSDEQKNQ